MTNEQTHSILSCPGKETMIPLLPCRSYDEALKFYKALGFDVTHAQQEPYRYIAVNKGAIHLHFTGSLGVYQVKNSFGSCLIFVDEVNSYHHTFVGDNTCGQQLQRELQQLPLSNEERNRFCYDLQAAEALEAWLTSAQAQ